MPGWMIGANQTAPVVGQQPSYDAIAAAFRGVNLPPEWGRFAGAPRVTRDLYQGRIITRAVSLWAVPNTQFGRDHSRYIAERVREAVVANLTAIPVPTGGGYPRPPWEPRGLLEWQSATHGAAAWWASGEASNTRTKNPFSQLSGLGELVAEQADGPGAGATVAQAAEAAAGETAATVANAGAQAGATVAQGFGAWLSANWQLVAGAAVLATGAYFVFAYKPSRREPVDFNPFPALGGGDDDGFEDASDSTPEPLPLVSINPFPALSLFGSDRDYDRVAENPAPALWRVAPAGTPYDCKSSLVGRQIGHGRFSGARVEQCATPLPVTAKQRARKKTPGEPKPERAYVLKPERGPAFVERASVVREGLRASRGQVGEAPPGGADGIRAAVVGMRRDVAEQKQAGAYFPEPPGLPYPARAGSNQCLPGSKPWRELEAATMERLAILEADGVPITRETLSAALEGDPAFRGAEAVQESCFRKWEAEAKAKAPKATLSTRREAALAREAARAAGVDLSSAEYRDTLEGEQRRLLRAGAARRRGGVRKAGGQANPSPRVEQALALHWDWMWAPYGEGRNALNEAKHALYEQLDWREQEELKNEQARLSNLKRRDVARWRNEYLQAIRRNPSPIVEEALGMHWEWSQLPAGSEERATVGREKKRWLGRMTDQERAEYQRELATFRKTSRGEAPASYSRATKSQELKADIARDLALAEWHIHSPSWDFETKDALDHLRSIAGVGKVSVAEDTRGLRPSPDSARVHLESAQRAQEALEELERGTGSATRSFGFEVSKVRRLAGLPTPQELAAQREAEERRAAELEAALAARAKREAEERRAAVVIETERRGRGLPGQARLPGINPRRVRVVVRRA